MNAPPRHAIYDEPGVKKITFEKDTKVPNSGTFTIQKEDHTLGCMLTTSLLQNPNVLFAGYKMPHPLQYHMLVRVTTTPQTTPIRVVQESLEALRDEVSLLDERFTEKTKQKLAHSTFV
eukprot:TRINITY_DN2366_c0_g1_i1.p1 TRINITY_DN2366_c0_g1~~TRINITY_DN2366_c0_g1_i1.p1  ORF type:complete len:119 (-),score=21.29 TRINITY_DN2366_c0_g1_i1:50-406(-)